jgi:NitT/TauT family transport system substrate-binding protein
MQIMLHKLLFPLSITCLSVFVACDAPNQPQGAQVAQGQGKNITGRTLTKEQSETASQIVKEAKGSSTKPDALTKVALLLNWYPEAEHGGFYAAQVHGIYEKFGLEVEIRPGGKTTLVPQELTLGRIQFGVANADDVLVARSQEVPLVALMAPIQNGPRCIMVRKDSGITSFAEIKNIKLQIDKTRPYVPFLKSKGFLTEGVEIVPFFGTVDQLVAGPGFATQGYNFSEPFMARQKGVEVTELMMSEIGYNPYCSLLISTEGYISKNQDVCKRMTQASIEGWKKYLASPAESNEVILAKNKQGLEKNALEFGVEALKPLCRTSAAGDDSSIGAMNPERWNALSETLVSLKMIDASKSSVDKAYTLQFQAKE